MDIQSATLALNNTSEEADKKYEGILYDIHLFFDQLFTGIGLSIGTRPWLWILTTFILTGLCASGTIFWVDELEDVKLFLPLDNEVRKESDWVKQHFSNDLRIESILVSAPNIFEPSVIQAIHELEEDVKSVVVDDQSWHNVCAGYTTWFEHGEQLRDTDEQKFIDHMMKHLNETISQEACIYQSLIKIWRKKDVYNLSREEISKDVTYALSDNTGSNILMDVAPLLSKIEYSEDGQALSARATLLNFILKSSSNKTADWELEFVKKVLNTSQILPNGTEVFVVAARSYNDLLDEMMHSNVVIMACGYSLIAVYVIMMISRCNTVEQRIYLSFTGLTVVGLAIVSSYGVCFYLGYFYGPLHPMLPFLLMGIGVDDMFVVMQCLDNISESDRQKGVPYVISKTLQLAGVSITVTSFTNASAFAIGVTTQMPFLKSFCAFAASGIFFLYVYEIIFFVSCLTLDERRISRKREGCCCIKRASWKPNNCSQRNFMQLLFGKVIGPVLMKGPVKVLVILVTLSALGTNLWGVFQLTQRFDPLWYLDQQSYPMRYYGKLMEYFPSYGKTGGIYLAGIDYYDEREALKELASSLRANPTINNYTFNPWFMVYEDWLDSTEKGKDIENKEEYYNVLTEFLLMTKGGQVYIKDIKFNKIPINNYNITVSKIQIQHVPLDSVVDQICAMESIKETVNSINFTKVPEHIAVYSDDYVSWTSNKIIGEELLKNLCLCILVVATVTVILLRNVLSCFWVLCCVIFTLINLLGSMYYLNVHIEIISSLILLLSAGLTVDYAAHVSLEFTRCKGTKNERAVKTLSSIGPAVFNGGFSTFLAFVLLSTSKSYVFHTFFKLFTCVVSYGLFHGLIFLPVISSLLGPNEMKMNSDKKSELQDQNGYHTVPLATIDRDEMNKQEQEKPLKTV